VERAYVPLANLGWTASSTCPSLNLRQSRADKIGWTEGL
jgi:hypothetical protein